MKKTLLLLLTLYQNIFSYLLKNILGVNNCCRFEVTCSEYARNKITKEGVIRGLKLSIKRLLMCQPLSSAWTNNQNPMDFERTDGRSSLARQA